MNGGEARREESPGPTGESWVRVLLVDDHPIVRDGLRHLIEAEPDLVVSGEASSGEKALKVMAASPPDLVIADLNLPGMDGFALIRRIRSEHPQVQILVVSMMEQTVYAERALRAGAHGFVTKADASEEVVSAIRRVARGELYVSQGLAMDMIGDMVGGGQGALTTVESQLTEREFEVFRLIGQGYRTRQIADTLELSVKTVETHQANIKRKLELRDARDLAYYAMRWCEMERPEEGGPLPR